MNFVFFSAHFPSYNTDFCYHLQQLGVNVLGIGDSDFQALNERLKYSLTEYYKVSNLENYDEILRAVGYFTFKYGKIDRFESLNEHWLETEARIRTDFNIEGIKIDEVDNIRRKSRMKHFFKKSGARTIRYIELTRSKEKRSEGSEVKEFISECGYPIIIKPDKGSGANMTYKITNDGELGQFLASMPEGVDFIAEEFIDGIIITYDGLVDQNGGIRLESSTMYQQSIMDVVNQDDHVHYVCLPEVSPDVKKAGASIIKAFNARERFFHMEFFKSRETGEIVALEINMRPPGAWMTDAINYTHDIDVYQEWAKMVVDAAGSNDIRGKYYTAYASRKHQKNYKHDHETIIRQFSDKIMHHSPIEPVFSRAMGNYAYQFRSPSFEEVNHIINFIQQEK